MTNEDEVHPRRPRKYATAGRATLIPAIAVPVVLLGTFGSAGGFSFDHQHIEHARHGARHRPAGG
jgi:hypothetical protein